MRPLSRSPVNRRKSVRRFNRGASRTKRPNLAGIFRGGYRF